MTRVSHSKKRSRKNISLSHRSTVFPGYGSQSIIDFQERCKSDMECSAAFSECATGGCRFEFGAKIKFEFWRNIQKFKFADASAASSATEMEAASRSVSCSLEFGV